MLAEQLPGIMGKIDGALTSQGLYSDFTYDEVVQVGKYDVTIGINSAAKKERHSFRGVITNKGTSVFRNGERYNSEAYKTLIELSVIPQTIDFCPEIGQSYRTSDNVPWIVLEIEAAPFNSLYDILLGRK